ncbi:MAG: hypothetical protein K5696_12950 [Lachnospiraceae bacterium]|nr:hypothetical protein [Lachnospiraceae bacterium]
MITCRKRRRYPCAQGEKRLSRRIHPGWCGICLAVFLALTGSVPVSAEVIGDAEPELDYTDGDDEELPPELQGKVLTEELQNALQESMKGDETDPEDGTPLRLIGPTTAATFDKLTYTEHPELDVTYDEQSRRFVYTFPNGANFSMTAPLGGIANEPVTVEAGDGTEFIGAWYEEQSVMEEADAAQSISMDQRGSWQFILFSDGVSSGSADDSYMLRGSVRIMNTDERLQDGYIGTPTGLTLAIATCNGEKQEITDPYGVRLDRDGNYRLYYTLGKKEWNVSFVRDTAPPKLLFTPQIEEVYFDCPVSWQIWRPDTEVQVYWDNMRIEAPENTVAANGRYRIVVKDAAGNTRTYHFVIARGGKLHPEVLLGAFIVLMVAGIAIVLFYRRRLTVV